MAHVLFTNVPLMRTCIGGLCPSLTFLQLGTWLEARGHRVTLQDIAVEGDVKGRPMEEVTQTIARRIVAAAPDVLGLSAKVPADGRFTRELVRIVRAELPNVVVVLGGIWASAVPREILAAMPEVDAVALQEGELGLAALCERLDQGLPPGGPDVPGMAYRDEEGHVQVNAAAPALRAEDHPPLNLGLMPSPERYTVFPYLTSKGCPYECSFCAECVIYPQHAETGIERLREDLARLDRFGHNYFLWLSDPLFGANEARLEAICDILAGSRFHFLLESRVDVLKPEQLPRLWEAGCELIYFGLESASFSSLKRMRKLRTERQYERYLRQTKELMRACMAADVTPVFGIINPVPGDRVEDLQQTYQFMKELAEVAKAEVERSGHDPGYHFYGFDYRFIRGTHDFARLDELKAMGATWRQEREDIFRDVVIHDASPEIPRALSLEFQRKLQSLVHTTPKGWERLQRSFPPQPLGGLG